MSCAVREAYRRLEQGDYLLGKLDHFLRNLETEMLHQEAEALREKNAELQSQIDEMCEYIISSDNENARLLKEKNGYSDKFHRILCKTETLNEFQDSELNNYKKVFLEQICHRNLIIPLDVIGSELVKSDRFVIARLWNYCYK